MTPIDTLLNARKALKESEQAELHGDMPLADLKASMAIYWLSQWRKVLAMERGTT